MTRVTDFDALISTWMSEGPTLAPERRSRLALDQIAATPQRRARPRLGGAVDDDAQRPWRLLAAVAAAVLLATSLGVAFRAGLIKLPTENPAPVPSMPEVSVAPVGSPDPSPSAPPSVAPEAGLNTFVAPYETFQIELPRTWARGRGPDASALYLVKGDMELSIRAGDDQERLRTCDEAAGLWENCEVVTATTLDALADAIGLTPASEGSAVPLGPSRTRTTLDGEPAAVEKIEALEFPASGAEFVTYVVAVHEGRPFIIRIWTPVGGIDNELPDILDGFTFLLGADPEQPDVEDGSRTFTAADGSFEIHLPQEWHAVAGPDPSALYLRNSDSHLNPCTPQLPGCTDYINQGTHLTIRAGGKEGVVTCDAPAGPWEVCTTSRPRTLAELGRDIDLHPATDHGVSSSGGRRTETTLGGEPAILDELAAYEHPARGGQYVTYVAAMHDGRPFILRMWTGAESGLDPILPLVLEGFAFTD